MQPCPKRFFLDSKHSFDDPNTRLPTLEAFDCPFVDDDNDQLDPTSVSATDRGAIHEENRGANTSTDRGAIPVVETVDEYDIRDGALRPGFTSEETSSRSIIDDQRIAKIYPHGTKIERRFNNGLWYPGTVQSGPYQFDDEANVTARWEILFDDGDRLFLSTNELQYCRKLVDDKPVVKTVDDDDDDVPYSSPMDDTPLDQRPEVMFPDPDEDLPPHLRKPKPYGLPILLKLLEISLVSFFTRKTPSCLTHFLRHR